MLYRTKGIPARIGLLALSIAFVGCSYVKRDDLNGQFAQVREDMQAEMDAGDRGLASRMDASDARVADLEARLMQFDAELGSLQEQFDLTVERLETAIRFNTPVYFAFDDADLRAQDRPLLERFTQVVLEYYPSTVITVEGFTDPAGEANYNLFLGQKRADAVREYLVAQGLAPELVKAVSYGEQTQRLIRADGHGPGDPGWQNRRVVLVIDHGDPSRARGLVTDG